MLDEPKEIDHIDRANGISPPLRMPEVLNFHRSLTDTDHLFGLNDLPLPLYMEEASLNFGKIWHDISQS